MIVQLAPWQTLNLRPLPHQQGSLRPTLAGVPPTIRVPVGEMGPEGGRRCPAPPTPPLEAGPFCGRPAGPAPGEGSCPAGALAALAPAGAGPAAPGPAD
ncbi:MAG: hypothetical protein ABSD97_12655, partial [Acidimicrobiales bacterium]